MKHRKFASKTILLATCALLVFPPTLPVSYANDGGGGFERQNTTNPATAPKANTPKPQAVTKKPKPKPATNQQQPRTNLATRIRNFVDGLFGNEEAEEAQSVTSTPARIVRSTRRLRARRIETAASGLPPADETRFVGDEIIVRFQLSSTAGARNRLAARLRLTHLDVSTFFLPGVTVHRYRLPPDLGVREAIATMEASGAVVNVQPNYIYTLQQDAEVKKLPQFANTRVGLSDAHAKTRGLNVRIAVIDTAVDKDHPEFSNASLVNFDVSDEGADNVDPHGTSIAGILAADTKLTGVAPEAEILGIAAFSKNASGSVSGNTWTIMDAFNVALKEGANVLNLSFAGPADPLLESSLEGAKRRNMIPVAAAGNEGPDAATLFPAGYDAVIAVTATDTTDNIYSKANVGDHVDIAAPGVGLLVLGSGSGFRTASGTSMATAYVSGIAALALSANPNADYHTLRSQIENSAIDLGDPGKDRIFGRGMPNAAAAVSVPGN